MDFAGIIFLLLPLLLLFFLISRTRKQQREFASVQSSLEVGRRVMMTSGIYGEIVSVPDGDDTIVLEVAPGVRTTWARQAVVRVVDEPVDEPVDGESATPGSTPPAHGSPGDEPTTPPPTP